MKARAPARAGRLLLLGLALGCLALAALLAVLHHTFARERADAQEQVAARRTALEQYARAALAQSLALQVQLAGPRLAAAAADPLLPADDLLLWESGRQVLPRHAEPAATGQARTLFEALATPDPAPGEPAPLARPGDDDGPWADRLARRQAFFAALAAHDRAAVEHTFRGILAALSQYVLPAEQDVPYVLAILDHFSRTGQPDPRLLRWVLHEGVPDGQGGRMESVQRRLLRRREAFTAEDFAFLVARTLALGAPAGVPDADFRARVADVGPVVAVPPGGPVLLPGGWFAVPDAGGARGVRVPAGPLLQGLTQEMRGRGLLGPEDRVVAPGALEGPLESVALAVESPTWTRAAERADSAFSQKTLLLLLCAGLAGGLVALALLGHRRKQRYLALQSDFVQAVSHELRTPLASIRVMAETLERRLRDEPRAKDYPTRIVGAVDGLALMVENILSFNRLDRGRWVARKEAVTLAAVLQRAHDKVVPHAARPVQWHAEGDLDRPLRADPELLELLLVNLARNAVQYGDRPEVVLRFTAAVGPGLHLEVADNGRGMSPAAARQAFTPFYRAPESAGTRGSGLGLALCQRIAALHGGRIAIARTGPEGTTFALDFPPEILG